MRLESLWIAVGVGWTAVMACAVPDTTFAGELYVNRTRPGNCLCIPTVDGARYETLKLESSVEIVAIAPKDQTVERNPGAESGSANGSASGGENTNQATGSRSFYPQRRSVETGGLTLDRVGITLFESGGYVCTGRLAFDGGPDAARKGAHAVVRVRGYAGTPQHRGQLDGMRLLFETSKRFFVRTGESRTASLIPAVSSPSHQRELGNWKPSADLHLAGSSTAPARVPEKTCDNNDLNVLIGNEFPHFTHIEIVLEYRKAL